MSAAPEDVTAEVSGEMSREAGEGGGNGTASADLRAMAQELGVDPAAPTGVQARLAALAADDGTGGTSGGEGGSGGAASAELRALAAELGADGAGAEASAAATVREGRAVRQDLQNLAAETSTSQFQPLEIEDPGAKKKKHKKHKKHKGKKHKDGEGEDAPKEGGGGGCCAIM